MKQGILPLFHEIAHQNRKRFDPVAIAPGSDKNWPYFGKR